MIGPRVGLRPSRVFGPRIGISLDELGAGGISGVSQDTSSGIYVPNSLSEWNTFISATGLPITAPASLWLCQEPSGSLADTLRGISLAPTGSVTYRNPVPGWSRFSVDVADGGANKFDSASASFPDLSTTSQLLYAIWRTPTSTPAAGRTALYMGGTVAGCGAGYNVGGIPRLKAVSGGNAAIGTANPNSTVQPLVLLHNKTAGAVSVCDAQEILHPTFDPAAAGKSVRLGENPAASSGYLYAAEWEGSAAEMSSSTLRSLLGALGWSLAW